MIFRQDLILKDIAPALLEKGVDGFFADNCDVYWVHPEEQIPDGPAVIMKGLMQTGKKVIINGGDTFLDAWCEQKGPWNDVITGINQESVLSYITRYGDQGAEIFLLEYSKDSELIKAIRQFCEEHGYLYYVSDSIELDG